MKHIIVFIATTFTMTVVFLSINSLGFSLGLFDSVGEFLISLILTAIVYFAYLWMIKRC